MEQRTSVGFARVWMLLVACIVFGSAALFAAETGSLEVMVVDDEVLPIPGATVTVTSPVMMGTKVAVTDETGKAVFNRLVPGLYQVDVVLDGFGTAINKDLRISLETVQRLDVGLKPAMGEEITIVADYPIVDTTTSTGADHIQLETVEALPVGRDYIAYMQLVSGVNVVANAQGADTPTDPAGKGGLNYSDRGTQRANAGKTGSRDNVYYIDGVNITDMTSQTGIMKFNNEVIQEQEIISSGVPAEYAGGKGVVANVVTKSGGNGFSGSVNFYTQPQSFVGGFTTADDRLHVPVDTKYDTAGTAGGPILKDRVWVFGSGQRVGFSNDVALSSTASATNEVLPFDQTRNNIFAKATAAPWGEDQAGFSMFWAGMDTTGSRDPNVLPDRRTVTDTGYNMVNAYYQRNLPKNIIFEGRYGHYGWSSKGSPINPDAGPQNNVLYPPDAQGNLPPLYERQFGGYSTATDDSATRDSVSGEIEYVPGNHDFKGGLSFSLEQDADEAFYAAGHVLNSLAPTLSGATLRDVTDLGLFSPSEVEAQILPSLNNNWSSTSAALDTNGDHTVSLDELYAATFRSANDHGLNFQRTLDVQTGRNNVKAHRFSAYFQDDYRIHPRLTINGGLRLENNKYVDSTGETIAHLNTVFLPRVGMSWDVTGNGRNKVSGYYGQFMDPLSFDMVHFAGNVSGRVRDEQIFLNNEFYTYRVRGSAERRDAVFTPNIKDSRAHELNGTFERDFGGGLVASVQGYWRKDTNIIEDYDLGLYLNTLATMPDWAHLALTPEDFGYDEGVPANANYFLSNLIGAKRRYIGLDFEGRKRFDKGHLLVAQYSWKDSKGNSQSDNNADLQGDFHEIDPRNPWMLGTIPGTIENQIKLYGSYRMPYGIDVGGMFYWNDGTAFTDSEIFLPGQYNIYTNRPVPNDLGVVDRLHFAQTGALANPSYYQIDIKVSYKLKLGSRMNAQIFLDVYNLTDNQDVIELIGGTGDQLFPWEPGDPRDGTRQLSPRRAFLGARLTL